jgi:hypothetical protein
MAPTRPAPIVLAFAHRDIVKENASRARSQVNTSGDRAMTERPAPTT